MPPPEEPSGSHSSSLSGGEVAAVVICVLLIAFGGFWFLWRNKDRFEFLGGGMTEEGHALTDMQQSDEYGTV